MIKLKIMYGKLPCAEHLPETITKFFHIKQVQQIFPTEDSPKNNKISFTLEGDFLVESLEDLHKLVSNGDIFIASKTGTSFPIQNVQIRLANRQKELQSLNQDLSSLSAQNSDQAVQTQDQFSDKEQIYKKSGEDRKSGEECSHPPKLEKPAISVTNIFYYSGDHQDMAQNDSEFDVISKSFFKMILGSEIQKYKIQPKSNEIPDQPTSTNNITVRILFLFLILGKISSSKSTTCF